MLLCKTKNYQLYIKNNINKYIQDLQYIEIENENDINMFNLAHQKLNFKIILQLLFSNDYQNINPIFKKYFVDNNEKLFLNDSLINNIKEYLQNLNLNQQYSQEDINNINTLLYYVKKINNKIRGKFPAIIILVNKMLSFLDFKKMNLKYKLTDGFVSISGLNFHTNINTFQLEEVLNKYIKQINIQKNTLIESQDVQTIKHINNLLKLKRKKIDKNNIKNIVSIIKEKKYKRKNLKKLKQNYNDFINQFFKIKQNETNSEIVNHENIKKEENYTNKSKNEKQLHEKNNSLK